MKIISIKKIKLCRGDEAFTSLDILIGSFHMRWFCYPVIGFENGKYIWGDKSIMYGHKNCEPKYLKWPF